MACGDSRLCHCILFELLDFSDGLEGGVSGSGAGERQSFEVWQRFQVREACSGEVLDVPRRVKQ